jgi:hypothetical protein
MRSIFVIGLLILSVSCSKTKTPEPIPTPDSDTAPVLQMKFHHKTGANNFSFGDEFTDDFGTKFNFNRASIYISRPIFMGHSLADTVFKAMNTYFLVTPAKETYSIGTVSPGHYHYCTFGIGVDSVANHSDPSIYLAGHALAYQSPSTHWNWNSGYIFTILEGQYDGNNDGIIDPNDPASDPMFTYHIGLNSLYRQQPNLVVHADVEVNKTTTFSFTIDYLKFLEGVDIKNNSTTHSMTNYSLAEQIANNSLQAITAH